MMQISSSSEFGPALSWIKSGAGAPCTIEGMKAVPLPPPRSPAAGRTLTGMAVLATAAALLLYLLATAPAAAQLI